MREHNLAAKSIGTTVALGMMAIVVALMAAEIGDSPTSDSLDAMTSNIASDLIIGLLPLVGAGLGASATIIVQHSSTKASRLQFAAQVRAVRRDEVKTAVIGYFEFA